jgi:hypothetical protein
MKNRNVTMDTYGRNAGQNRSLDFDDFFDDVLDGGGLSSGSASQGQFGVSLQDRIKDHLPLPKLGLSSPWLKTGRKIYLRLI